MDDNVFKFQGSKMIVSAKGPNISMNKSFRPNLWPSTMNLPQNFENQSSAASVASSQRSIYHGRDMSPTATIHSDLQPRNFHQPFFPRGRSQRSVYDDRAMSPASMRSIDTTASRVDIVIDVLNSCTYDEWEKIFHVVNRKRKIQEETWRKEQKKMLGKDGRYMPVDENEQESLSSISDNDCASTRTGYSRKHRNKPYRKENRPRSVHSYYCRSEGMYRSSNRDTYSSYSRPDLRNSYQIDRPANMLPYQKQPQFGSMRFSERNGQAQNVSISQHNTCGPKNTSQRYTNSQSNISSIQRKTINASCSTKSMQNMTMMSQKDSFRGVFQFPSVKFNRSTLFEEQEPVRNKQFPKKDCDNKETNQIDQINEESDENDDIFIDTTAKPKTATTKRKKRKGESLSDLQNPTKKKPKTNSSNDKIKAKKQNEFDFVKPQFPARKLATAKPKEKIISKSAGAPDVFYSTEDKNLQPQSVQASSPEPGTEQAENPELTTSDLSMRPSFMKRKLFTQTLDFTEGKNNSFDSSSAESPQNNMYSALSKEKHKTRKLVTSQSLLSRDVNQDNENLLDLIHKIVPQNQVNSTVTANNSKPRVNGTKNDDDKWDITSIISTCNNDSISETYTDDEIFQVGNGDPESKPQEKPVTKKNKQFKKNEAANKPESKKSDNNINSIQNIKDVDINTNKNSKHVHNVNAVSNKIVSHTNNDIAKDVGNTKTTNNKKIKDIGETKQKNNKICKDFTNLKTAKPKNFKDSGNKIKLSSNNITTDVGDVHSPNIKNASKNPLSCKNVKDGGNKHITNNYNNDKDIVKRVPPAAPKTDTPTKPCPSKRVLLSRSRVDAFWDTDDSDHECAGASPRPRPRPHHGQHRADLIHTQVIGPKESGSDSQLSTKVSKTNRNPVLSPVVVLQVEDKVLIEQASKKAANTTQSKTLKDSHDKLQPKTLCNNKKVTPNTQMRTRRQVHLSATLESVNNSDLHDKDKEDNSTITAEKKRKTDKNNKTKPSAEITKKRNRKQNKSQIDNSKERVETPKSLRHRKKSKLQKPANHNISKVLRSRTIDLSSSFNSDKFELTKSRTQESRTPSKRISFSKSKNMLPNNKIRNRAAKS